MTIIYMVRHGRAAASFTDDLDPGLDELGRDQAIEAGRILQGKLPLQILSSPLRRARETASPLAQTSGLKVSIENRVSEIPSPGMLLEERGPWLQAIMQGEWKDQTSILQKWQGDMVKCLLDLEQDTAIFTHFVAINAIVTAAENAAAVLAFRPDNGSITVLESDGTTLKVVSRGSEANTRVN
jgi:broad specificity phosphatase PhoE